MHFYEGKAVLTGLRGPYLYSLLLKLAWGLGVIKGNLRSQRKYYTCLSCSLTFPAM